jgi:hypothetical protein
MRTFLFLQLFSTSVSRAFHDPNGRPIPTDRKVLNRKFPLIDDGNDNNDVECSDNRNDHDEKARHLKTA